MAYLNLLPWREAQRQEQQKRFVTALVFSSLFAGAMVFVAYAYVQGLIEYQNKRNTYLDNEIAIMDKKIAAIKTLEATRKALLDRMEVIENLQETRPSIVHLFDEIVKALPDGLYIQKLKQVGTNISLEGEAESNARVSSYMDRLDATAWLSSSNLHLIEKANRQKTGGNRKEQDATRYRYFNLDVTQVLKSPTLNSDKTEGKKP